VGIIVRDSLFRSGTQGSEQNSLWGEMLIVQPVSYSIYTLLTVIIVFSVSALIYAGNYARKENVVGFLVPEKGTVKVFAPQKGSYQTIFVEEGQHINAGDKLASVGSISRLASGSQASAVILEELDNQIRYAEEGIRQLEKNIRIERSISALRKSELETEQDSLKQQRQTKQGLLELKKSRVEAAENLVAKNLISSERFELYQHAYLEQKLEYEEIQQRYQQKMAEAGSLDALLRRKVSEVQERIADYHQKISDLKSQRAQTRSSSQYFIHAPVSGQITALQAKTGQAVSDGKPVLAIIPQDSALEAHLFIPTKAIGFIQPGQTIDLKYSAFPYQRFGVQQGEIREITKTILSPSELPGELPTLNMPVYRVVAQLDSQSIRAYGKHIELQTGMTLDASIIIEKHSIWEWMLSPLYSLKGRI